MTVTKPEAQHIYEVYVSMDKMHDAMNWVFKNAKDRGYSWLHLDITGVPYKVGTTFLFRKEGKADALECSKLFGNGGIL